MDLQKKNCCIIAYVYNDDWITISDVKDLKKWGNIGGLNTAWKCAYLELFWSVFFRIRTEYGEILSKRGKIRTRITTPNMDTFYAVEMKSWNWEKARNFHFYFSCYSLNIEKNKNDRRTKLQLFSFTVQFHASSYFLYFVHDCWFLFQSFNPKFCPQQPLLLKKIKTAAINRIITVKSE